MSRIGSKNTQIELRVFSHLRRIGIHFQRHYRRAPGSPDIAQPRRKRAVFIDGDFWHGWRFAGWSAKLTPYWCEKIGRNIRRDRRNRTALRRAGWSVLRVWEHELEPTEPGLARIREFLAAD